MLVRCTIDYLGHTIFAADVAMDKYKLIVIQEWPRLVTFSQLRGFLGLARYFREFMCNYASLVASLTD